ncbi:hypothetical protein C8F04DRAFT_1195955 [Mycena alexandri]|uniref:Uncharacterized protein n=1 Tax=Mycena alexandri TaxID=1745969 RepID=A0AAD6WU23_9AGAR|nr:hypothetical protein C8F04DRAFT_1195955 [Mycena alexandri]
MRTGMMLYSEIVTLQFTDKDLRKSPVGAPYPKAKWSGCTRSLEECMGPAVGGCIQDNRGRQVWVHPHPLWTHPFVIHGCIHSQYDGCIQDHPQQSFIGSMMKYPTVPYCEAAASIFTASRKTVVVVGAQNLEAGAVIRVLSRLEVLELVCRTPDSGLGLRSLPNRDYSAYGHATSGRYPVVTEPPAWPEGMHDPNPRTTKKC